MFSDQRGFTFIEIAAIIIVIGLMAAVAVPKFHQISIDSRKTATQISLGSLRSDITIFYANQALVNGKAQWPIPSDFEIVNRVTKESIPCNPYQSESNAPDSIVICYTKGEIIGTRGGWAYNPKTGDIWANTNIVGENNW